MGSTTVQHDRVSVFLRKAEISPPSKIPTLVKLPSLEIQISQNALDQARSMLVEQRTSEPDYKPPEKHTLHRFKSTLKLKEARSSVDKCDFTKHEVGKAFGALLGRAPLEPLGIAQALLSHISPTSIIELWCHVHDKKFEKKMSRRLFPRRRSSALIPELPWLDWVTRQENLDYIRLLCQAGVEQEDLDQALVVALSQNSIEAMEVLLSFGAVASSSQDAIQAVREHVRLENLALVTVLLSAPTAMSVEAWRSCMEPEVQKETPTIFLQCLAHRPDVVCGSLLLKSLEAENFWTTAIAIAYSSSDEDFCDVRQRACELTSCIQDNGLRLQLFSVLAMSGFVTDSPILREELMKDVKTSQLQLVQLLVDAGITLDVEPYNAVHYAVSRMELDILELFRHGTFSLPISLILNSVPDTTSEPDMLQLMDIFGPRGLSGDPLDNHLIRAARKQQVRLVETLLAYGASIEFQHASAVRAALQTTDLAILTLLLQNHCSPEILSTAIPVAMELKPRSIRLQAIHLLTQKGILAQELGIPLQTLVSEDGDVDMELIRLLLQHHAPLDYVGDVSKNAVLVATRRGLLSLLELLCDAAPREETVSNAIPIAFSGMHKHGHEVASAMIKLLLQKGGTGLPAHQTLLAAVRQGSNLEIVRLLVEFGADANYGAGACFNVAVEGKNFELLEVLCAGSPPSSATTKAVLLTAIKPPYFNLQMLELLLTSTATIDTVLNASWTSEMFKGNPNVTQIVPCFLRHGLNIDLGNGTLLCFAIQEQNFDLLGEILWANPSVASLTTAFQEATRIRDRNIELLAMRLLLEKSDSAEIGQSEALVRETAYALADDLRGMELLLRHNASVDFDRGAAVQAAAAAGSLKALAALLSLRPTLRTIKLACLAAASSPSTSSDQKRAVLQRLLDANGGVSVKGMSEILANSVATLPECTQLPELLLARGANADLEIVKIAMNTSSRSVCMVLANSIASLDVMTKLFRHARQNKLNSDKRYWIYEYLLGRGISKDEISEALLESLKPENIGDLSLSKLLLKHGASVDYKSGAAFTLAFNLDSLGIVTLLSQHFVDHSVANLAFELARRSTSLRRDVRFQVYRCFLQWRIDQVSIYHALLENLKGELPDVPTVNLLLENGADPNKDDARCFVVASANGAEDEFRALSRHENINPQLILRSLLGHFREEWQVVWWFRACLEEQSNPVHLRQDDLLFQCMRKFPEGTTLLKLLLDKGVSVAAKVTTRLCPGWEPEICTGLIWALFSSTPRIGNDPILTLLSRGRNEALPAYSTSLTKVSAAFACVLDATRTDVLKALIDLDRDRVTEHTMLESKFCHLAAYPEIAPADPSLPENINELRVRVAAVHAGNFDAFLLLQFEDVPNDGMIHMAALLALPKFVRWLLLHGHDAYSQKDGPNIPLALACWSKYQPSCKIANKESTWSTRQEETMRLLAPGTDIDWKYGGKTVLHVACDAGHNVAKAMIGALNVSNDPERDDRYLLVDKSGIHYSPDEYVNRVLIADAGEKLALLNVLKDCDMMSRYYRAVEPKEGKQPEGYHGLPPRLEILWNEHEEELEPSPTT